MPLCTFQPASGPQGKNVPDVIHISNQADWSSAMDPHLDNLGTQPDVQMLVHSMEALDAMAKSIASLEDGYFKAFHEVITHTETALWDILHIDLHYVSQVVTLMKSWQEAIDTVHSHMLTNDTALYLTR